MAKSFRTTGHRPRQPHSLPIAPARNGFENHDWGAPTHRRSLSGVARAVEKNRAPSQWGRRLARLVGEKFGVQMSGNFSKNEGTYRREDIVIKCAKSPTPPVTILVDMLERVDKLWAVYLTLDGGAEVWEVDTDAVRRHGYFTKGPNVQKRVEVYRRKIVPVGSLVGTLSYQEVESCQIP